MFVSILFCALLISPTLHAEPLEIELKFKLPDQQAEQFKQSLALHASAQQVSMQETYFMGHELHPIQTKSGYKKMGQYLRLRETKKGSFITLKKRSEHEVIELETKIEDAKTMASILKVLGYGEQENQQVHLKKQRTKYLIPFENHQIEVVFDTFSEPAHLQKMGEFIEIELKSEVSSYQEGILVLKRFLLTHGITHIDKYPPYIELAINEQYAEQVRHIELAQDLGK